MKVIWEPLLKGKFDNYYKDVSMAWLWARIHIRANSRSSKNPLSKEMLGYFKGGFNVLIKEIIKQLKKQDVEIFLNSDISSITSKSDKNSKPNIVIDKKNFQFSKIIATVPNHVFSKLIISNPNLKNYLSQLNKITYLGAVLIVFSSKQDLSKYYWHNINDLNSPFLVLINHTKLVGTKDYQNNNLYYLGSYVPHDHKYFSMEDKELYNLWFDQVRQIFPDFEVNKVVEKHIFKFKYAQHIVDRDYLTKIPSYQTPLKNVYLSNFSQIFPEDRGTNYAVREGNKIAELISNNIVNE
jgi:protoporphyrinogen oxidase